MWSLSSSYCQKFLPDYKFQEGRKCGGFAYHQGINSWPRAAKRMCSLLVIGWSKTLITELIILHSLLRECISVRKCIYTYTNIYNLSYLPIYTHIHTIFLFICCISIWDKQQIFCLFLPIYAPQNNQIDEIHQFTADFLRDRAMLLKPTRQLRCRFSRSAQGPRFAFLTNWHWLWCTDHTFRRRYNIHCQVLVVFMSRWKRLKRLQHAALIE